MLAVVANSGDRNGVGNTTEPCWSLWRPKAEIEKADFDSST